MEFLTSTKAISGIIKYNSREMSSRKTLLGVDTFTHIQTISVYAIKNIIDIKTSLTFSRKLRSRVSYVKTKRKCMGFLC